ncbi:MAG: hypothetical protein ABIJ65_05770 [Chloroflexota bacterium]
MPQYKSYLDFFALLFFIGGASTGVRTGGPTIRYRIAYNKDKKPDIRIRKIMKNINIAKMFRKAVIGWRRLANMGTFQTQAGNFTKPSRPVGIGHPLVIPVLTNSMAAR